jgi:hypothetical protein
MTRRIVRDNEAKPLVFPAWPAALLSDICSRAQRTSGQGAPDRGEYRQAAGVVAKILNTQQFVGFTLLRSAPTTTDF